jgi:hypothetical protein
LRKKNGEIIEFSHSEIFVWKKVIEKAWSCMTLNPVN